MFIYKQIVALCMHLLFQNSKIAVITKLYADTLHLKF